jgi:hypothetical protein
LEIIDPRGPSLNAGNPMGLWWPRWARDRRLCTLSDLLILTATA